MKMNMKSDWNLERVIKFHLEQNNLLQDVRNIPYIMYAVRNINGTTRWSQGNFSEKDGFYIKYHSEFIHSTNYKNEFENSGLTIDFFYRNKLF